VHDAAAHYRRPRFPSEIIAHCVWLYHRFTLSFRNIEEMMAMQRCKSPGQAQRFLSAFSGISPRFRPRRHRLRAARIQTWREVAGLAAAA
jgi:putative transposase